MHEEELKIHKKCKGEWAKLIGQLSHLLSTKLATIRLKENWLQEACSSLFKHYEKLKGQEPTTENLSFSLDDLKQMSDFSQELNSSAALFKKINQSIRDYSLEETFSLNTLVKNCLEKEVFQGKQDIIHTQLDTEVECMGSKALVSELLIFLLTRILNRLKKVGQGSTSIEIVLEEGQIVLHIKEIGSALLEPDPLCSFEHFVFIENDADIIIGLGFFRLSLWQQGGSLQCYRDPEKFTDFIIRLKRNSQ